MAPLSQDTLILTPDFEDGETATQNHEMTLESASGKRVVEWKNQHFPNFIEPIWSHTQKTCTSNHLPP